MKVSLDKICQIFGYTRQAYYKREELEIKRELEYKRVLSTVQNIRRRQPMVGVRKLQVMLFALGTEIGRDRLFCLLREHELLIYPKRCYHRTTYSNHRFRTYKNLVKELTLTGSNQVFVSDITYIKTLEGYCYLSLITDKYSRKIVGYHLSKSLAIEGTLKALRIAMRKVKFPENLIHHSDRGIQYCSNAYVKYLKQKKVRISMTEENHVYENALAERVNGILKNEFMLGEEISSFEKAKKLVKETIGIYNEERLHLSLGYITPAVAHAA